METQAKQVVNEFLTAVQQGKYDQVGAFLHPDIEWSQPGNNRLSGIKKSVAEVFQMVGQMLEISANTFALTDFRTLSVNGNQVACVLHWQASQPSGRNLSVDNIDVYTLENGRVVQATIYTADPEQEDRFWGQSTLQTASV